MGNILLKRKLAKFELGDCKKATDMFDGELIHCKVVKVYDGDTITVVFRHPGGRFYEEQCRLLGFDAPEMHPAPKTPDGKVRSQQSIDAERAKAAEAREFLVKQLDGGKKLVKIRFSKREKYGRLLGTVFVDSFLHGEQNINQKMIDSGLVHLYDGGTKQAW